jgi:hypothetical protein
MALIREYRAEARPALKRWNTIATLLSMDVVAPFYDLMGLRIRVSSPAFQAIFRKLILRARGEFPAEHPVAVALVPEILLDTVDSELGDDVRVNLEKWGAHIFQMDIREHVGRLDWAAVLRRCRDDDRLWRKLQIPLHFDDHFRREFLHSISYDEYYRRLDETYQRPLSDWDLRQYSIYEFSDDDPGAPNGPDSYMYPAAMNYQASRFWAWAVEHLETEQRLALLWNAEEVARSEESLQHIVQLTDPIHLAVEP